MSTFFPAQLNCKHATLLSSVVGKMQAGEPYTPTPEELVELGNLAGAINMWANKPESPCQNEATLLGHIPNGDYERKLFAPEAFKVVAYSFNMPDKNCYMSAANYAGDPWLRNVSVSTVLGDMNGPKQSGPGKTATVWLDVGDFPPGTLLYANMKIEEPAPPGTTGSGFSIVW